MMSLKRWIAVTMAALLLLYSVPVYAGTLIGYVTIDGVQRGIMKDGDWWYYDHGGGITLYHYSGSAKDIVLPDYFDGVPVTAATTWAIPSGVTSLRVPGTFGTLPDRLLYSRSALHTVVLEEGVQKIGASAFYFNTALTSLTLPSTLKEIGADAFHSCGALTSVTIHSTAQLTIGNSAFRECDALKTAVLDGVAVIGENAFYSCDVLSSVTCSNVLRTISASAFFRCSALTGINLGSGLQSIGPQAFYGSGLTALSLPASLLVLGEQSLDSAQLPEVDLPDTLSSMTLPIVNRNTVMVVGSGTAALAAIQSAGYSNYRLRGQPFVPGSGAQAVTVSEKVADIIAQVIRDGMSDYQKALALHDYLTENAQYDVSRSLSCTYDADGVLLHGAGVCQSYAEAYALLLNKVGIPNTFEYGEDHIWNMVCLDGEWLHVDVTWDDPLSARQGSSMEGNACSGRESHIYFGLNTESLESVEGHECYNRPHVSDGYKNSYAYRSGALNSHIDSLVGTISSNLQQGRLSFSFQPSTFGGNTQRNNYGVTERMSLAAVRDREFTVNGNPCDISLSYNVSANLLTVTASVRKEAVDLGVLTVSAGDSFLLTVDGAAWRSDAPETAEVTSEGRVTPVAEEGTAVLTGETATGIYTLTLEIRPMSTLSVRAREVEEANWGGSPAARVFLSAEVKSVGKDCFTDMPNLKVIYISGSTVIGEGCFRNCPNAVIFTPSGSPAALYAETNGIPWYPV